ncbi:MAG: hypothetical protein A2Z69_02300 [Bacteroidetes bacterium RBG_13_44_24]|nr:MAG: hypothetical protein A2Z69_02300 [Bacteroidetes bacterium RBG_13_44_24]
MAGNAKNIRATKIKKWHESLKTKTPTRLSYKEKCRIIFFKRQKYEQVPNHYPDSMPENA